MSYKSDRVAQRLSRDHYEAYSAILEEEYPEPKDDSDIIKSYKEWLNIAPTFEQSNAMVFKLWEAYISLLSHLTPSESAKDVMALAEAVTDLCVVDERGAIYYDTAKAAALIRSSFAAWRGSPHGYTMVNTKLWDQMRERLASRQSASEPSGELDEDTIDDLLLIGAGSEAGAYSKPVARAAMRSALAPLLASRPERCGYDMGGECAVDQDKPAPTRMEC